MGTLVLKSCFVIGLFLLYNIGIEGMVVGSRDF